jgi:hypothetical protein
MARNQLIIDQALYLVASAKKFVVELRYEKFIFVMRLTNGVAICTTFFLFIEHDKQ